MACLKKNWIQLFKKSILLSRDSTWACMHQGAGIPQFSPGFVPWLGHFIPINCTKHVNNLWGLPQCWLTHMTVYSQHLLLGHGFLLCTKQIVPSCLSASVYQKDIWIDMHVTLKESEAHHVIALIQEREGKLSYVFYSSCLCLKK